MIPTNGLLQPAYRPTAALRPPSSSNARTAITLLLTAPDRGVAYRIVDANNYMRAYISKGRMRLVLERVLAGTVTELATAVWTRTGSTAEIQVLAVGYRHRIRVNQRPMIDTTDDDLYLVTATKFGPFSMQGGEVTFDDIYGQGV